MGKQMKSVITVLVFSISLNMAFGAMWAVHRLSPRRTCTGRTVDSGATSCISCPLHRTLGTTEEQWQEIEPRLEEFKSSSRVVCQKIKHMREELIDLVAAPQTDIDAIRAKQDEILAGQRRMQDLLISHLLAEKEMLTPRQQETLFGMLRQYDDCAGSSPIMGVRSFSIPLTERNNTVDSDQNRRR